MKRIGSRAAREAITEREGDMEKREIREEAADRVAEAVRHALRLVGPVERGLERVRETIEDRPAA